MPENNNIMSVEGQLVGMPLAGPESFSQAQLDYLKRALGVDETVLWSGSASFNITLNESVFNFSKLKLQVYNSPVLFEVYRADLASSFNLVGVNIQRDTELYIFGAVWSVSADGLTLTASGRGVGNVKTASLDSYFSNNASNGGLVKVIGIGRIAGGN